MTRLSLSGKLLGGACLMAACVLITAGTGSSPVFNRMRRLSSSRSHRTPVSQIAKLAPMRLDGEIVGPAGGVQWRELIGADADEILVKGPTGVTSTTRAAFLAGYVS